MKCFIDKNKEQNLIHGVEYYAVGLIVEEYGKKESGKEVVVEYIDPFGEYCCEWRAYNEIDVFETDDNYLEYSIRKLRP